MYYVEDEVDGSRRKMWRANDEKYNKLVSGFHSCMYTLPSPFNEFVLLYFCVKDFWSQKSD